MRGPSTTARFHSASRNWWADAVFYRISPRSFADSSGNAVGDIDGIRQRLGYLELLGIDGIWLTSVLRSPVFKEPGNDRRLDPMIGESESLEQLVTEAHAAGIRVAIDLSVVRGAIDDPDNRPELDSAVRFWLDHGVDGFRVCTSPGATTAASEQTGAIVRAVRPAVDDDGLRFVSALIDGDWYQRFGDRDELDLGIDLRFASCGSEADALRPVVDDVLRDAESMRMVPAWTRACPDRSQPVLRYGSGTVGLARSKAMLLVKLALPGVVGLEGGEELGLLEADLPGEVGVEPLRSIMLWEGTTPPFGFSEAPGNWWPMTEDWAPYTVEAQLEDPTSTLSLYRRAMEISKTHPAFRGEHIAWYGAPAGCLAFHRVEGGLTCALNTSRVPVPLPDGDVLLTSDAVDGGRLPPNAAAWLVTSAAEAERDDDAPQPRTENPSAATNPSR